MAVRDSERSSIMYRMVTKQCVAEKKTHRYFPVWGVNWYQAQSDMIDNRFVYCREPAHSESRMYRVTIVNDSIYMCAAV